MHTVKQLLPWGETTLLGQAVKTALQSRADKVYLVLGAHKDLISEKLDFSNIKVVENNDWRSGMGGSIARGTDAILDRSLPEGILVMLCDQPLIDSEYLNHMIDTFQTAEHSIIGTSYGSKIGVPALFSPQHFNDLRSLTGAKGAGSIIRKHSSDCLGLNANGKEVDIDTEAAYNQLYNSFHSGN